MLIVDVSMLVRRTYAKMDFLKNSVGVPTGMEFGTLRTLEMLEKKYPEQETVLCFDSPKNFKRDQDPEYKANRRPPSDEFYKRLRKFLKFLRCLYPNVEVEGHEADELMYSIAKTRPGPHLIYTNDHDLLQAVDKNTTMLKSFHSKLFMWDADKIREEYGLSPGLLPMYFAFTGDKVDNVIGVPRISKKFLAALIRWADEYGMPLHTMLREIVIANWKPKMKAAIVEFVDSGQWQRNYDLIKLEILSFDLTKPTNDDDLVFKRLKKWEILSLGMCKKYEFVVNEEF